MNSNKYDLVILDIMGVRGFELLDAAVKHKFPVAMLTAHALTPEALKRSIEMMARVYLPKEKMGEIVPFLEYVLKYEYLTGWNALFKKLKGFFNERWGKDWQKADEKFWKEFNTKLLNCELRDSIRVSSFHKGELMADSILNGKRVLAVDDEAGYFDRSGGRN